MMDKDKKLKKNDAVLYDGWLSYLAKDQYLFQGEPVVDLEAGGIFSKARVPISKVSLYKAMPE